MASSSKLCCMNVLCRSTAATEWRSGWELRSGGFANLCDKCGYAYELLLFCNTFHSKDTGWRECSSCRKRLHCGCIASKALVELLDDGGVECIGCSMKSSGCSAIASDHMASGLGMDNVGELRSPFLENKMDGDGLDMGKEAPIGKSMQFVERKTALSSQRSDPNGLVCHIKRERGVSPMGDVGSPSFSNMNQPSAGPYHFNKRDNRKEMMGAINAPESLPSLRMNLGSPTGGTNPALPISGSVAEGRDLSKMQSPLQQGQRSRHLLPKPSKLGPGTVPETKDIVPQIRVARPPVEGRGKCQLLPRYWPRITEQELQQISGDSNSTIVPLFEKILSASDAGRIGRLVLPKACAEAYFPPISRPEGLPLRIQDVKGKEWVFQFRFWPNNNSRMYVLEGVTPCIQAMQLQAGDTVTFSRIDPERKLVMGFRKASNSVNLQDTQTSALANGAFANTSFFSGVIENLPIISGYSGLLQSLRGSADSHPNTLSEHIHSADGESSWQRSEKLGNRPNEGLQLQKLRVPERKRSRNIGMKNKRLHIDHDAALELKLTWEEAQDLLRPPPCGNPNIVTVEEHIFEEYEEPPVFGKKTIFTSGPSGSQQWAQCDSCYKWRRLPVDALLAPNWTCAENVWDANRRTCSAPDELSQQEIENLLRLNTDHKRQKIASTDKVVQEHEPSGLDALATAAGLGDNGVDSSTPFVATTTKHPRHRPGCTCIVCIQPPSGKGPKHDPTCTCNVCMTVRRRFKTLMLRKKKRQSEKEAEIAERNRYFESLKDETEVESSSRGMLPLEAYENEAWLNGNEAESSSHDRIQMEELESSNGHIDLNNNPGREEEALGGTGGSERVSMTTLVQVASLPLDTYLKQNGLRSLIRDHQTNSSNSNPPVEATEGLNSEEKPQDEGNDLTSTVVQDQENLTIAAKEQDTEVEEGNQVHEPAAPPQNDQV